MPRNEIFSEEYNSRSDLDDNDESCEQTILERNTKYSLKSVLVNLGKRKHKHFNHRFVQDV